MKWLECIVLIWIAIAVTACSPALVNGGVALFAMLIVSPLAALMFLAMLKAFVLVIIVSSAPLASIILRQCVYYHDRFLATFCEEPITFGKGY